MKTRITIGLLLLSVASLIPLCARSAVKWIEKDFDFGLMKEIAGPQTGHARFVNIGSDEISIVDVKPSCGCTSADFSDAPVAPGDTATIYFTYDPAGRPGKFQKTVKVRLSDDTRYSIPIQGNVLGTPESLASLFPVDAGDMRLSDSTLDLKDVVFGHTPVRFFSAYSLSPDSISPRLEYDKKGLSVNCSRSKAGPGDMLTYSVDFNSMAWGKYGPVELPVSFKSNPADEGAHPVVLAVKAFVLPDTSLLLAAQHDRNPRIQTDAAPINLGSGIGENVLSTELEIRNSGTGSLHVLNISSGSKAISFGKLPKEIKTGKSTRIKVTIDAGMLPSGVFRIPVDIVSDDPDHPRSTLFVTGQRQ